MRRLQNFEEKDNKIEFKQHTVFDFNDIGYKVVETKCSGEAVKNKHEDQWHHVAHRLHRSLHCSHLVVRPGI